MVKIIFTRIRNLLEIWASLTVRKAQVRHVWLWVALMLVARIPLLFLIYPVDSQLFYSLLQAELRLLKSLSESSLQALICYQHSSST